MTDADLMREALKALEELANEADEVKSINEAGYTCAVEAVFIKLARATIAKLEQRLLRE